MLQAQVSTGFYPGYLFLDFNKTEVEKQLYKTFTDIISNTTVSGTFKCRL